MTTLLSIFDWAQIEHSRNELELRNWILNVSYFGPLESLVSLAEQFPLQVICCHSVMAERAVGNLPVHLSLLGMNPG